MMPMPVQQRMSADEFLARPFGEGPRWQELVEGELVVNEPTALHNLVQTNLLYALLSWVRGGDGRGRVFIPLDVKLDDHNVFAPDISWYAAHRAVDVRAEPPYPRPDLAVEIRSRSTWQHDIGAKKSTYERHGLPELWLADTAAEELLVFRRSQAAAERFDVTLALGRGDALKSPLLPGFALPLDELFETS